jgi:hypothetical protein
MFMRFAGLILLLVSHAAHAGNRVGNGGNVLECAKPVDRPKAELLDFYEAQERGGTLIKSDETDYKKILSARLAALEKNAPKLAEQYRRRAASIESEFSFKPDIALTDTKDSLHVGVPSKGDCKVKQTVIRQGLALSGEKRFAIDKEAWDQLDARNRAGLILHEIIYEHFFKLGAEDSRTARRLNGLVFSEEFDKLTPGKFWQFIAELHLPLYP